jgi:hypothetical protein
VFLRQINLHFGKLLVKAFTKKKKKKKKKQAVKLASFFNSIGVMFGEIENNLFANGYCFWQSK